MSDLTRKPVDELAWSDVEALAAQRAEEGQYLEFKSGGLLEPPNAKHAASAAACKAIVAFANAYGGTFLLGIKESDGVATLADPVKNLSTAAESLERAVRDRLDPPIAGLQFKSLDRGDGAGVIVIRVPPSQAAPHGHGEPPQAYIRAGKNSRPMTMRDMQSLFWDARARRERVEAVRAEHSANFLRLRERFAQSALRTPDGNVVRPSESRLFMRITAIPQERLNVPRMPVDNWRNILRPSNSLLGIEAAAAFGDGSFSRGLARVAHGLCAEDALARWMVTDDGTVSVIGSRPGFLNGEQKDHHWPGWYISTLALILVMADRVRRFAGAAEANYEVDCEVAAANTVIVRTRDMFDDGAKSPPLDYARIGPFLLQDRSTIAATFASLETELWGFFGREPTPPLDVRWDAAWAKS